MGRKANVAIRYSSELEWASVWVSQIVVAESHCLQGTASSLLREVIDQAERQGKSIGLGSTNPDAVSSYPFSRREVVAKRVLHGMQTRGGRAGLTLSAADLPLYQARFQAAVDLRPFRSSNQVPGWGASPSLLDGSGSLLATYVACHPPFDSYKPTAHICKVIKRS